MCSCIDWVTLEKSLQGTRPESLRLILTKLDPDYDYGGWGHSALVQAVLLCYIQMTIPKQTGEIVHD